MIFVDDVGEECQCPICDGRMTDSSSGIAERSVPIVWRIVKCSCGFYIESVRIGELNDCAVHAEIGFGYLTNSGRPERMKLSTSSDHLFPKTVGELKRRLNARAAAWRKSFQETGK